MKPFSLILLLTLVLACNQKPGNKTAVPRSAGFTTAGWDSVNRYEFINACMEEQQEGPVSDTLAYSYCKCMLEQMEQRFPHPDSISFIDSATLRQMQENCLK